MINVDKDYLYSDHYKQVKSYLEANLIEGDVYKTRKSAILASMTPFGFLSCYLDANGDKYYFCNGRYTNMTFLKQTRAKRLIDNFY